MTVRSSMADLIQQTRLLINDTGTTPVFSDQQVQDQLDQNREVFNYMALAPVVNMATGAAAQYLNYYAIDQDDDWTTSRYTLAPIYQLNVVPRIDQCIRWWESDATVCTASYVDVTSSTTANYQLGQWTFTVSQQPPLLIVGKSYDIYRAASELVGKWIALYPFAYDIKRADGASLSRSQISAQLNTLRLNLLREARPRNIRAMRNDAGREQVL